MTIEIEVIADSVNQDGKRITTIQTRYPRFIHAQVMTHRMLSRNAKISRAMPVKRLIEEINKEPVIPMHWGENQKGMQADKECNELMTYYPPEYIEVELTREEVWEMAKDKAIECARLFSKAGYHKEIVNRLLEPFDHISVIITATEWQNFFDLRCQPHSQPEIEELANKIRKEMKNNKPKNMQWGEWHLPYIDGQLGETVKTSVACAARVSYNNHDGSKRNIENDNSLHDMLLESKHMSPFEHQARAMRGNYYNLNGWCSYRWELEKGVG